MMVSDSLNQFLEKKTEEGFSKEMPELIIIIYSLYSEIILLKGRELFCLPF